MKSEKSWGCCVAQHRSHTYPEEFDGKQRMDQRGHYGAADQKLECKEARQAEFAGKAARCTHMHQPGLDPTFEPARSLPEPRAYSSRCFLVCARMNDRSAIAKACEPHAEIRILGYVIGVPGPNPA